MAKSIIIHTNSVKETRTPAGGNNATTAAATATGGNLDKPRNLIKLGTFSGRTPLQLFLRRFEICTKQNQWSPSDQLNHLSCALSEQASQLIWDKNSEELDTVHDLVERLKS